MLEAILVAVGMLFVLIVLAGFYASRYKKVGPNQVLVVSGRKRSIVNPVSGQREVVGFRVVKGGGTFILPVLERVDILSMEILTIEVEVRGVYTVQGVPVHVDGVAQIKIRGDDASIYTAAEQFLSKGPEGIVYVAHETLAGHLRAILGMLTVEEIYKAVSYTHLRAHETVLDLVCRLLLEKKKKKNKKKKTHTTHTILFDTSHTHTD